jgi:CrcB protein
LFGYGFLLGTQRAFWKIVITGLYTLHLQPVALFNLHFVPGPYKFTGFCGSLTTFSGWQLDVFNSWINATKSHRGGLRDFVDGTGKTAFTLAISIASVSFGAHIARAIKPHFPSLPSPSRSVRYCLSVLSILMYAATLPAYFKLSPSYRHQATAALLFAFPGALTRYLLSIQLNPRNKTIPLGTFTANAVGTALLGTFHVLQSTSSPPSQNACAILQGLADGYCGCLTTISTFAVEVVTLKSRRAWFYVLISGQGIYENKLHAASPDLLS